MATTSQAIQRWEAAVAMLAKIDKLYAGKQPQPASAADLLVMVPLGVCLGIASGRLATPHRTWEVLLKKQVSLSFSIDK